MGVPPFLVASCVLMVVAQRLCRRVCLECRVPQVLPLSVLVDAGFSPSEAASATLHRGMGCASCAHTGFRGRTALYEVLPITPEIQEATVRRRSLVELAQIAARQGMRTLRQAGLLKAARGITTLDEVLRVTATG